MSLAINPEADGQVRVPLASADKFVTVDMLRSVDHARIAALVGLTLEQLEADVIAWAFGPGRPYGVVRKDTA